MNSITFKIGKQKYNAPTASFAVMNWLSNTMQESSSDIVAIFGPYHEKFVSSVIDAIQLRFGKLCQIDPDLIEKEWYQNGLPEDKFNPSVIKESDNKKVEAYENWCHYVIEWLNKNHGISDLKIQS